VEESEQNEKRCWLIGGTPRSPFGEFKRETRVKGGRPRNSKGKWDPNLYSGGLGATGGGTS